jgi:hypothetical protein
LVDDICFDDLGELGVRFLKRLRKPSGAEPRERDEEDIGSVVGIDTGLRVRFGDSGVGAGGSGGDSETFQEDIGKTGAGVETV